MIACFRVDSSIEIGTGHVIRCLTLAQALRKRGAQCIFICREHHGSLLMQIRNQGFEVHSLSLDKGFGRIDRAHDGALLPHAAWLGTDWATDAAQTKLVIAEMKVDWLIVDHYALDVRWELALKKTARRILVIDDIADRQHGCDMLLDQNLYADMKTRYALKAPTCCQLLLGPGYALLRDEFRQLRDQTKPRSGPVKRILVFFGGVDADNYTEQVIGVLAQLGTPDVRIDVVIGIQHPARKLIETECVRHGFNCHVQTDKMAELMAAADLAIGAGGSACWERCCLGLPALLVALADNQINIAKALDLFGACVYAGTVKTANASLMLSKIDSLLNSPQQIQELSRIGYSLVDGLGVSRVCERMGC